MKKIYIFIGGMITGVVLLFVIAVAASLFMQKNNQNNDSNNVNNGIVLLDSPASCVSSNNFKVIQVLDSGEALAQEMDPILNIERGVTVLFLNENETPYYDEQIIKIPKNKCAKQIGYLKYKSKGGFDKTVPVVKIMDK